MNIIDFAVTRQIITLMKAYLFLKTIDHHNKLEKCKEDLFTKIILCKQLVGNLELPENFNCRIFKNR